jgi:hypothetical protein
VIRNPKQLSWEERILGTEICELGDTWERNLIARKGGKHCTVVLVDRSSACTVVLNKIVGGQGHSHEGEKMDQGICSVSQISQKKRSSPWIEGMGDLRQSRALLISSPFDAIDKNLLRFFLSS